MNTTQMGLLLLTKSAVLGEPYTLPQGFCLADVIGIAKKHQITNLVYYGAVNCGYSDELPEMIKLLNTSCFGISKSEIQKYEIDRICKALEESGIDYMPLKGIILKEFYPKSDMRLMGDADILIRTEQYDLIRKTMASLGFVEKLESDHEYVWFNNALYLELHKRLIPSYNKDYYTYFGDGWRLAKKISDHACRYEMSDEDFFIYIFTHFAKHYRDAGVGIKHLVDLWIIQKKKELDLVYISNELKKLDLCDFYHNIQKVISVWFEDEQSDEKTDFITNIIFNSGAYGTNDAHLLSAAVRDFKNTGSVLATSTKKRLHKLFLPYKDMCIKYPILKKLPVLLPFMWLYRWGETLLHKRKKIMRDVNDLVILSSKNIQSYQDALRYVGLDFKE